MKTMHTWRRENSRSIPFLYVLSYEGKDVGMISRSKNTCAWACFAGIGEPARLIGHRYHKGTAMQLVEVSL